MGDGNSSSINNNMVDAYDRGGDHHTNNTTTNGFWTSQSHHHHHGLMMMMNSASSYHHQNHDEPPLPPLPPSTAIFNGGPNNNSSVASTGYYFVNRANHDAEDGGAASIKAKIMAHPHYPSLLSSYVSCQKVGAPPEVVKRLEEAVEVGRGRASGGGGYLGEDPALDQFMEAYCEMLTKYEQELTKPFKEAMVFLSKIECQFKALSLSSSLDVDPGCGEADDRNGSPVKEIDMNANLVDPQAEDRELKCQLLRKYSGYLGNLKQEFMKKRKKGKLPKEARQQLLDWWTRHYKWPYPSESQKLALAEATGLDQKQINNWFINQRKRHWKPSEDMQFVVVDAAAHHHVHPHYYMDNLLGNPYSLDVSPALL